MTTSPWITINDTSLDPTRIESLKPYGEGSVYTGSVVVMFSGQVHPFENTTPEDIKALVAEWRASVVHDLYVAERRTRGEK